MMLRLKNPASYNPISTKNRILFGASESHLQVLMPATLIKSQRKILWSSLEWEIQVKDSTV